MNDFVNAFKFIGENGVSTPGDPTLTYLTLKQLELSAVAIAVALVIAIPIGLALGHRHRGSFVAINISNFGRALPSLAVIAILVAVLGIGFKNVAAALVVLAVPPMLTNAYVAIDGVDPDIVDAARGMGMRERQILVRVELPLALPLIFVGIRTAAVFVVATATIAAFAGYSGTLGDIIANQAGYRFSGVLGASICVAALALAVGAAFAVVQHALTPRGLRIAARDAPGLAAGIAPVPVREAT